MRVKLSPNLTTARAAVQRHMTPAFRRQQRPVKVLVADDDQVIRRLISHNLELWGYEIQSAADGAEAMAILQSKNPPRIAILDWMMPTISGPEICTKLRRMRSEKMIYTILLTSKSDKGDLVRAFQAGAHDYIAKPPDFDELHCRIDAGRRMVANDDLVKHFAEEMREAALTDPLTGIGNRRRFFEQGSADFTKAVDHDSPLAIIMIDIDHFKHINDDYGHDVGDRLLKEFTKLITPRCGKAETFARIGGEEFVILCKQGDAAKVCARAERLRLLVEKAGFSKPGAPPIKITISMGISLMTPEDNAIDSILNRADKALYRAKTTGRNRTVLAS